MSPKFQKHSALKFVGRIIPGAKRRGIMKLAKNKSSAVMSPKFQKRSAPKSLRRTIPCAKHIGKPLSKTNGDCGIQLKINEVY